MGMTIQEIIAAQQRAVNATCKNKMMVARKPATNAPGQSIQAMLQVQQAAKVNPKVVPPSVPGPKNNTIAEMIEQQRIAVAARQAATSGMSQALSSNQRAVIDSIRDRYKAFLAKLDKELAGQELVMPPPAPKPAEPIFAPNVPASEEIVIEAGEVPAGVNGISVGEEMGGQVAVTVRPKRKRKAKTVKPESEPAAETPAVDA